MIQHMVHPIQVRHEKPAEGARVACHEQPGVRCPFQPVRLPAYQHTFHRRWVSQHTKYVVSFVLLVKAHFLHGFQYF